MGIRGDALNNVNGKTNFENRIKAKRSVTASASSIIAIS